MMTIRLKKGLFLYWYGLVILGKMIQNLYEPLFDYDGIYIIFIIVYSLKYLNNIVNGHIKIGNLEKTVGLIILYIFLFGFVFVSPMIEEDVNVYAIKTIVWIWCLYLIAHNFTAHYDFETFLKITYITQLIYLIYVFCVYFEGLSFLSDIGDIFNVVSQMSRNRNGYGSHANITGLYIVSEYMVGLILCQYLDKNKKRMIIAINYILAIMLMSTASRNSILSSAILLVIYWMSRLYRRNKKLFIKILKYGLVFALVAFAFICANINRYESLFMSFSRFYPIALGIDTVIRNGNIWTGIGYCTTEGLNILQRIYGINVAYMENFYVYVFVSSGIIGIFVMLYVYYRLLRKSIISVKNHWELLVSIVATIGCFLFAGLGEQVGMSSGYEPSWIFMLILFILSDAKATTIENSKSILRSLVRTN